MNKTNGRLRKIIFPVASKLTHLSTYAIGPACRGRASVTSQSDSHRPFNYATIHLLSLAHRLILVGLLQNEECLLLLPLVGDQTFAVELVLNPR